MAMRNLIFIHIYSLKTCRERERKFELIAKTQSIINSSQQKKKDTGVYKILTSSVKRGDRIINLTFVRGDRDVCDQCVQLVWGIFIFITFPGETHTHAVRHVPEKHATCIQDWGKSTAAHRYQKTQTHSSPDAFSPHSLVETSIDADVWCSHLLYGKLTDLLQCTRSSPLERPAPQHIHLHVPQP